MNNEYFAETERKIPRGTVRTRFAPSPTGYMHVGNLRTALFAYLIAKRAKGAFLLRVEDTDQNRLVEGSVEVIYKTLRECKLQWDEGPDIGGPVGPYIQTQRREIYSAFAQLLIERGGAYRCFCSQAGSTGGEKLKYDGRCSRLSEHEVEQKLEQGVPYVIRQRIPQGGFTTFNDMVFGEITVANDTLDDNVLIKSDGLPTYNFANVVDDHLMGITHVVRGAEYLSSTPKYDLLYKSFGWDIPQYVHCAPVMRDSQNKMSKRHGDPSYEDLIAQGYLTQAVVNYVALLGWSPGGEREIFSLDELSETFDIGGISKSPAIFDVEKLAHFNSEYIRAASPDEFAALARPYINQAVKNPDIDANEIAPLLHARCEKLSDIPSKLDFFDALPDYDTELYVHKKSRSDLDSSVKMLFEVKTALETLDIWTQDSLHDLFVKLAQSLGVKNSTLMWPVRIAVTGKLVTPGGAVEICRILGKPETLNRIHAGINKLQNKE